MSSEVVSVIIPVFNSGNLLAACLQSVSRQTLTDWECILVDDGSFDGSADICDQFSGWDPRFKVIHQPNSGVSSARNRGLAIARGKYIAFIDSDDIVAPCYLESLYYSMISSGSDLAVCGLLEERNGTICGVSKPNSTSTFTLDESGLTFFAELEKKHLLFGPVAKLYRQSLIEGAGLRFDESLDYGEDLMFNLVYVTLSSTVSMVPEALYTYRRSTGTLSTKARTDFFVLNYKQWKVLFSFHSDKKLCGPPTYDYMYSRLWGIIYDGLFSCHGLQHLTFGYIRDILSIPEILDLKSYQDIFHCSKWIKRWILDRRALLFYLYFRLLHKR